MIEGSKGAFMDNTKTATEASRIIDLTSQTDVDYWCRIFNVEMAELRNAVHHSGHRAEDVERYLRQKKGG
jgi:hypothetical protein